MKKILLTLSAALTVGSIYAQVTITSADIPAVFTVIREANDTLPSVAIGNGGSSQTWNYAALANHREDTTTYTQPQFTPFGSTFPAANMATVIGSGVGYGYMNSSSSQVEILGQAGDPFGTGIVAVTYSNPEVLAMFPAAYGGNEIDTASSFLEFYLGIDPGVGFVIDSVRIRSFIKRTNDYDGWGSVTTPTGTYNVLRQNTLRVQYDTIDIYAFGAWIPEFFNQQDSNRVYSHWANGMGNVCELTDAQDLGQITSAKYLLSSAAIGVPEFNSNNSLPSYPNPANDAINFATAGTATTTIMVFSSTGELIASIPVNSTNTLLDVSTYASGLYFYQAIDAKGNLSAQGKFSVAH
jgi:Secretion system C-terminal sorting domain